MVYFKRVSLEERPSEKPSGNYSSMMPPVTDGDAKALLADPPSA